MYSKLFLRNDLFKSYFLDNLVSPFDSVMLLFDLPNLSLNFHLAIAKKYNQLEKLEAAKAAWLVYLSLLSLTGSFLALLGLT